MRIGFDVDGVLNDFISAYCKLVIEVSGRNLFEPSDWTDPPCWNWPEYRGYDKATMNEVWRRIKAGGSFWFNLKPTEHMSTLALVLHELEFKHDVYYCTNRMGVAAKRQTEAHLMRHLPYDKLRLTPTVLLAGDKGAAAKALNLDVYIDDNLDNIKSVLKESEKTRAYLLNCVYNQGDAFVDIPAVAQIAPGIRGIMQYGFERRKATRVKTLGAMFDAEIANL